MRFQKSAIRSAEQLVRALWLSFLTIVVSYMAAIFAFGFIHRSAPHRVIREALYTEFAPITLVVFAVGTMVVGYIHVRFSYLQMQQIEEMRIDEIRGDTALLEAMKELTTQVKRIPRSSQHISWALFNLPKSGQP